MSSYNIIIRWQLPVIVFPSIRYARNGRFHLPLSLLISPLPCPTADIKQISVPVAGVNGEMQWAWQDNRLFRHSSHFPFNSTDAIDKSKFITLLDRYSIRQISINKSL